MTDRISIVGISALGYHGVLPDERRDGQPFSADVTLHVDTAAAARTDNLADTVDYGAVAQAVAGVLTGDPVDLVETLADRIAQVCLADARVERVDVTVHKPEAPVGVPATDVTVSITRTRP